jgi:hypothetical protein
MALMLNVDPEVRRGEVIQCFKIEHAGQEMLIKIYVQKSTGNLKMVFDGPKSFGISRFKEALTSSTRDHDRSPSSKG